MDSPTLLVLLSVAAVLLPLVFAWWLLARCVSPKRRPAARHGQRLAVRPKADSQERPAAHD